MSWGRERTLGYILIGLMNKILAVMFSICIKSDRMIPNPWQIDQINDFSVRFDFKRSHPFGFYLSFVMRKIKNTWIHLDTIELIDAVQTNICERKCYFPNSSLTQITTEALLLDVWKLWTFEWLPSCMDILSKQFKEYND